MVIYSQKNLYLILDWKIFLQLNLKVIHINSLQLNNKAILCDLHSLMMAFFTDYVKTLEF